MFEELLRRNNKYIQLNKSISKILQSKRDKNLENYINKNIYDKSYNEQKINELLTGLTDDQELVKTNLSFIEYYETKEEQLSFDNLKILACRIIVTHIIVGDLDWTENEVNKIKNYFAKQFVYNKIKEVTGILLNEKTDILGAVAF